VVKQKKVSYQWNQVNCTLVGAVVEHVEGIDSSLETEQMLLFVTEKEHVLK
jgi:hypothetical protein